MPRFRLRGLLVLTLLVAGVLAVVAHMRAKPRQYSTLDEIVRAHGSRRSVSGTMWEVYIAPDIDGPFRLAGDDRVHGGIFQSNAGRNVSGWVDTGTERRPFNLVGIPGVSFLVIPLENPKDEAAYLVLKR